MMDIRCEEVINDENIDPNIQENFKSPNTINQQNEFFCSPKLDEEVFYTNCDRSIAQILQMKKEDLQRQFAESSKEIDELSSLADKNKVHISNIRDKICMITEKDKFTPISINLQNNKNSPLALDPNFVVNINEKSVVGNAKFQNFLNTHQKKLLQDIRETQSEEFLVKGREIPKSSRGSNINDSFEKIRVDQRLFQANANLNQNKNYLWDDDSANTLFASPPSDKRYSTKNAPIKNIELSNDEALRIFKKKNLKFPEEEIFNDENCPKNNLLQNIDQYKEPNPRSGIIQKMLFLKDTFSLSLNDTLNKEDTENRKDNLKNLKTSYYAHDQIAEVDEELEIDSDERSNTKRMRASNQSITVNSLPFTPNIKQNHLIITTWPEPTEIFVNDKLYTPEQVNESSYMSCISNEKTQTFIDINERKMLEHTNSLYKKTNLSSENSLKELNYIENSPLHKSRSEISPSEFNLGKRFSKNHNEITRSDDVKIINLLKPQKEVEPWKPIAMRESEVSPNYERKTHQERPVKINQKLQQTSKKFQPEILTRNTANSRHKCKNPKPSQNLNKTTTNRKGCTIKPDRTIDKKRSKNDKKLNNTIADKPKDINKSKMFTKNDDNKIIFSQGFSKIATKFTKLNKSLSPSYNMPFKKTSCEIENPHKEKCKATKLKKKVDIEKFKQSLCKLRKNTIEKDLKTIKSLEKRTSQHVSPKNHVLINKTMDICHNKTLSNTSNLKKDLFKRKTVFQETNSESQSFRDIKKLRSNFLSKQYNLIQHGNEKFISVSPEIMESNTNILTTNDTYKSGSCDSKKTQTHSGSSNNTIKKNKDMLRYIVSTRIKQNMGFFKLNKEKIHNKTLNLEYFRDKEKDKTIYQGLTEKKSESEIGKNINSNTILNSNQNLSTYYEKSDAKHQKYLGIDNQNVINNLKSGRLVNYCKAKSKIKQKSKNNGKTDKEISYISNSNPKDNIPLLTQNISEGIKQKIGKSPRSSESNFFKLIKNNYLKKKDLKTNSNYHFDTSNRSFNNSNFQNTSNSINNNTFSYNSLQLKRKKTQCSNSKREHYSIFEDRKQTNPIFFEFKKKNTVDLALDESNNKHKKSRDKTVQSSMQKSRYDKSKHLSPKNSICNTLSRNDIESPFTRKVGKYIDI